MLASHGMRTFVLLAAVALAAAATLSACTEKAYEPTNDSLAYSRTAMHPAGSRVPLPQGMGLVLLNISIPSTSTRT